MNLYFYFYNQTEGATGLTDVVVTTIPINRTTGAIGDSVIGVATEIGGGYYLYNVDGANPTLYDYASWAVTEGDVIKPFRLPTNLSIEAPWVWQVTQRKLTMTPDQLRASVSGATLVLKRGDTNIIPLTLGSLTGNQEIWFTVKGSLSDADSKSIVQITKTIGLTYINKTEPDDPTMGSIVVLDENLGMIEITLSADEALKLLPANNLYYDVQVLDTIVSTRVQGTCNIEGDVTRSITVLGD